MINEWVEELKQVEEIFKLIVKKKVDIYLLIKSDNYLQYNIFYYDELYLTDDEYLKIKNMILNYRRYL